MSVHYEQQRDKYVVRWREDSRNRRGHGRPRPRLLVRRHVRRATWLVGRSRTGSGSADRRNRSMRGQRRTESP
jgi:hypothetical protein